MTGRKPAKNFNELYPGWPDLSPCEITDQVDARFLHFVHKFREIYKSQRESGQVTSIKHFSQNLDISTGLTHGLLRGEKFPSLETVLKLEEGLDCTLLDPYNTFTPGMQR